MVQHQAVHLTLPNLIIAGTNKAGTTSIFRYLAAHPQTCASSIKEPRFFSHHPDPLALDSLVEYAGYFQRCTADDSIIFEASPQYLAGGITVARKILQVIPDVRLAFILRDPVDRLMSFYKSYVGQDRCIVRDLSLESFVDRALAGDGLSEEDLRPEDAQLQRELYRGNYYPRLVEYLSVFRREKILILFFDELIVNPRSVMCRLSEFAALDSEFYSNFNFTVENKTRNYRSAVLNRRVHDLNLTLEPIFNRMPVLRRALRRIYTMINERRQDDNVDTLAIARLRTYYRPHCQALRKLMRQTWPELQLPEWLKH